METKKKFEKNIFTEVIEDKSQKEQNDEVKDNSHKDLNNHEVKENEKSEENKNKKISQKNLKTIKKINKIISQDFILIEDLRNICWKGIPSDDSLIRAECWKYLLGL